LVFPIFMIKGIPEWIWRKFVNIRFVKLIVKFFTKPLISLLLFYGFFSIYFLQVVFYFFILFQIFLYSFMHFLFFVVLFIILINLNNIYKDIILHINFNIFN